MVAIYIEGQRKSRKKLMVGINGSDGFNHWKKRHGTL